MSAEHAIQVSAAPEDEALLLALKSLIDAGATALQQERFDNAIENFENALSQAPARLSAYDVATHNVLTARKRLVERLLETGNLAPVQQHLQRMFELRLRGPLAAQAEFRGRFAAAYYDLGKAFYRA